MLLILGNTAPLVLSDTDPLILSDGGATVPDAIDDLAGTPGVESIEFTWSAPDDGGAAITKYTLYLDGVEHTDDVTSPYEVTGLTGGVVSGPWTVTATNSEGESDPSNAVTETPESAVSTGSGLTQSKLLKRLSLVG
jgi:hypothetical protein